MNRFIRRIGDASARRPWTTIGAWAVLAWSGSVLGAGIVAEYPVGPNGDGCDRPGPGWVVLLRPLPMETPPMMPFSPRLLPLIAVVFLGGPSALSEVSRVRRHLIGAETVLARRDESQLSAGQLANRRRVKGLLAEYRRAGQFPRNEDFAGRLVPYFRDRRGTLCAMACTGPPTPLIVISATSRTTPRSKSIRVPARSIESSSNPIE